jgi:preprotein translocase subunit SecA
VLGTERHDARRIDNQLRGRSGRQGDPGETAFFVSLDDHLMRVFGGDSIKNMMGKLGIKEDEPIENRLITKSLESAQQKIEGFNFDARKHVLEFDDVLNFQRKIMYGRRREILLGDKERVQSYIKEITVDLPEEEKEKIENKVINADEAFIRNLKAVILQTTDMFWVEHLEVMDYMRSSVNLRAYGQRDPLVEYKKEGLKLFIRKSVRSLSILQTYRSCDFTCEYFFHFFTLVCLETYDTSKSLFVACCRVINIRARFDST